MTWQSVRAGLREPKICALWCSTAGVHIATLRRMSDITIAIMEANTVLGREITEVLRDLETPWFSELRLFGESDDSFVRFGGKDIHVQPFTPNNFDGVDIALLGGTAEVDAGAISVALADSHRDSEAPVIDPLLNRDMVDDHRGLIYVPDGPSLALARLVRAIGCVQSVCATILQPASQLGPQALEELYAQSRALFNHEPLPTDVIGGRLAFNVLPGRPINGVEALIDVPVQVTPLLVPVFGGTILTITATANESLSIENIEKLISAQHGLESYDSVEPADVVGDSSIRVQTKSTSHSQVQAIAAVDEVQCAAQAICDVAREVVLQDAF